MADKDIIAVRLNSGIRDRLDDLSKRRNTTLSSLSNSAIEKFLNEEEYNFQDFLKEVDLIPSLSLNKVKIETEMKDCPPFLCKQIIDIIKGKEVFLFEATPEDVEDRIKNIDTKNLYGIFIHLTIEDINKLNETIKKIINSLKNPKELKLGFGAKNNHHNKILLFVAYNKKGEKENETKKKD
jgi:predicted DNA-binding protein